MGVFSFRVDNLSRMRRVVNLSVPSSVDEIFQDAQADIAGFFGVKLRGENIFVFDSCRDLFAVIGRGGDNFFVGGGGVVAVHEVEVGLIAQARRKF